MIKPGLRERKKERTRQALIDAAISLFSTKGYEEVTIAEITDLAEVSARTFFSYFPSKEAVLFAGTPLKLEVSASALSEPLPGERPAQLLLRAFSEVMAQPDSDVTGDLARLRAELIFTTPALQGYALRQVLAGHGELTRGLVAAYPDELDEVTAAALSGAVVGTIVATIAAVFGDKERAAQMAADPEGMEAELGRAIQFACRQLGSIG